MLQLSALGKPCCDSALNWSLNKGESPWCHKTLSNVRSLAKRGHAQFYPGGCHCSSSVRYRWWVPWHQQVQQMNE